VLRSKSERPAVAAHRNVLHKIGVTGGDIARRISATKHDPTFLMADVEVTATYELFNVNRTRLEKLIHRVFDSVRLDIEIKYRFEQPVIPCVVLDETKEGPTVNEINHERCNRLIKARTPNKAEEGGVAGAMAPGERERDWTRLLELKHKNHPMNRSTPPRERAKARRKLLKLERGKKQSCICNPWRGI